MHVTISGYLTACGSAATAAASAAAAGQATPPTSLCVAEQLGQIPRRAATTVGVAPADRILKVVCPGLKQEPEPEVHGVIDGDNHLGTRRVAQQDERETAREDNPGGASQPGPSRVTAVRDTLAGIIGGTQLRLRGRRRPQVRFRRVTMAF
jgi:hypothetical protein